MPQAPARNLGRMSEIAQVAVKHGFGYFFETHRLTDLLPWHAKVTATMDGQASPRGLQDDVSPFPFTDVERVISEDLGLSIERLFLEFEERPMAAASIGQVHRAVLPNGRAAAVKVQRPGAPARIEAD